MAFGTGPGRGRQWVALDERREEIADAEAHQAHRRQVEEAKAARGPGPVARLLRRLRGQPARDRG